ncbi:hypothetical protein HYFRA_00001463 [Hymenoscyphus fraxineus]|uniref:Cytochrome P450 n=1 Tax=Hymenoscyphus fraxineus TaxID=746836 RepID=A0A9N9L9S1_9HELO|nr:hypothetical protein HYFRA_00001463 [Hymenoscyphus fraxineus]
MFPMPSNLTKEFVMASIIPDVTQWPSLLMNLAYALSILSLPFIITYTLTAAQSALAISSKIPQNGASLPVVPYTIPYLGNLISFATNKEAFISKIRRKFGTGIPLRIKLGTRNLIYVSSPSAMLTLFRHSKDLTTIPSVVRLLQNTFGAPSSIRKILERDNTGLSQAPLDGSNPLAEKDRYWYNMHRVLHTNLQGTTLEELSSRFIKNLEVELEKLCDGLEGDWLDFPDFFELVRRVCFKASVVALCGPHIFHLTPNFADLFWDFDANIIDLTHGKPRWLIPEGYRARDRYLAAVKKWNLFAKENAGDYGDAEWDEFYGSKVMRERTRVLCKVEGYSADMLASQTSGMIWAANGNIIPAITWCLIDTLTRPSLLTSVLQEISSSSGADILSISALLSSPLLQSLFSEELRLRTSVTVQRSPQSDFQLGSYTIPKGSVMFSSSWHEQKDPAIWNESPTLRSPVSHPLTEFWAERFLIYDDDPYSGPSSPSTSTSPTSKPHLDTTMKPKFTIAPVSGSFIPFGGGKKVCPGRFYAKYEAICGMALFLSMYEIELDVKAGEVEMDKKYFFFGVMPPKNKISGRMRRRL